MNDSRWENSPHEELEDLDTVAFDPPGYAGRSRLRRGWLMGLAAFAVGVTVGAGVVYESTSTPQPEAAQPIPTTTTVVPEPVIQPALPTVPGMVLPVAPGQVASYHASCQAEADHRGGPISGPVFVASVQFDNTTGIGWSYWISATWNLPGGHNITRGVVRLVPMRAKSTATITVPATSAEIGANRAIAAGAPCTISVTLLNMRRVTY